MIRNTGFIIIVFLLSAVTAQAETTAFSKQRYRLAGGHVQNSSPTLADLTGDGLPEILIGTTACSGSPCVLNQSTRVEVWRGNGTRLWSKDAGAPVNSAPSVADIDGDGMPEVVVSVGGDVYDMDQHGGVVVFEHDGTRKWFFQTVDFYPLDGYSEGVYSTPTICDVDNNGDMEIAFGAWDQRIYLLDHEGNAIWNNIPNGFPGPGFLNADSSWSSPACFDLNGDGMKEIIIGADITGGGILPDGTHTTDGGFVYIFDKDGNILVRRFLPESVYSSPAIGDLDGDGTFEIVIGTAWYWWNVHGRTEQPYVYAFDTSKVFGSLAYDDANKLPHLPGWPRPTEYPGFSSPALADLDGDGNMEVIIGTGHPDVANDGILGSGRIHAWHHNGQPVAGWPIAPQNQYGDDAPIFSSPTVADVDADGQQEILFSMLWDVQIYNADGSFQEVLPANWTVWGSPGVGDTNGDGNLEVWIGGSDLHDSGYGYLWRFENGAPDLENHHWPMFHGNATHSGISSSTPAQLAAPKDPHLAILEQGSGDKYTAQLTISNSGGQPLEWQTDDLPAGVQLSPASGTLDGFSSTSVTLSVGQGGRGVGTYELELVITGTSDGEPAGGSPAVIPITLSVLEELHRSYIPFNLR